MDILQSMKQFVQEMKLTFDGQKYGSSKQIIGAQEMRLISILQQLHETAGNLRM